MAIRTRTPVVASPVVEEPTEDAATQAVAEENIPAEPLVTSEEIFQDDSVARVFTLDQWCSDFLHADSQKEFLIFAFKIHAKQHRLLYNTPENWNNEFSRWLNSPL